MAKLIYVINMSLDGYISDAAGNFDWTMPSDEVHAFINDLERSVGTYLYGRRMYETMLYWETADTLVDAPPVVRDFTQIWQGAEKIVYSTTLDAPSSARTRLEREFDPAAIRELKRTSDHDMTIAGPDLAAHALRAGLVDEMQFFVGPMVLGGGARALPDEVRQPLELLAERRFESGTVYLNYRVVH